MISLEKYAPTNFVPAVAVIRRGRVLSVMTGRKGRVGCISVDGGAAITGGGKLIPEKFGKPFRRFPNELSEKSLPQAPTARSPPDESFLWESVAAGVG